ncbi:NUDIX domain-containing protein [Candidatus Uhrbacteria bacterium]|nr:NUDIX domain-containing protein [Candidatus Uhrbacteria bacterium]
MVVNEKNEMLLLRRANTGYRDGFYDMPAGHLEEKETLRQATVRELKEETGLVATEDDLEFLEILHRFSTARDYIDVFFRVKKWTGEAAIQEPEKCDHLGWFPIDAPPEMIVPHQRSVIQDRLNNTTYREVREKN